MNSIRPLRNRLCQLTLDLALGIIAATGFNRKIIYLSAKYFCRHIRYWSEYGYVLAVYCGDFSNGGGTIFVTDGRQIVMTDTSGEVLTSGGCSLQHSADGMFAKWWNGCHQ